MAFILEKRRSPLTPPANGQDRLAALPTEIRLAIYDYLLPFHVNIRELEKTYPSVLQGAERFPSYLPCPAHPLLALASVSHSYRAGVNEFALDIFRQWPHLNRHYRIRKQRWTHFEKMLRKSNIAELIWLCARHCVHCGRGPRAYWASSQFVSSYSSCCSVYGTILVSGVVP